MFPIPLSDLAFKYTAFVRTWWAGNPMRSMTARLTLISLILVHFSWWAVMFAGCAISWQFAAAEGWRLNFPHACQARSKGIDASLSDPLLRHLKGRKGRHQGPQITYLQFCWFLVIFFFILAVINDFYWKDMYICIHFIKCTYLFHFPWRIYTSMCFSDATPGRGGRANIYIYIYI